MAFRLKRGCAVLLVLGAVVLVLAMVATWVVDSRYEAVFRAPRVTHDAYTTGDTCLKVVVRPILAKRQLADLLLPQRQLPDWLLAATMPEETALLFDADLTAEQMRATFFANYTRLGPAIRDALNQQNVGSLAPGITWSPPEVVRKERGVLVMQGTAPMPPDTAQSVAMKWGTGSYPPPKVDGQHAFEAVLENRNGKGYAVLLTLMGDAVKSNFMLSMAMRPESLFPIGQLRITADYTAADTMSIQLVVDANPAAPPDSDKGLQMAIDALYGSLRTQIKQKYDADLSGTTTKEGRQIRGDYVLAGADKVMRALIQVPEPQ